MCVCMCVFKKHIEGIRYTESSCYLDTNYHEFRENLSGIRSEFT